MESGNVGLHQISVEDDVNLLHRSLHHRLRNLEPQEPSCGVLEAGICLGHLLFSVGGVSSSPPSLLPYKIPSNLDQKTQKTVSLRRHEAQIHPHAVI